MTFNIYFACYKFNQKLVTVFYVIAVCSVLNNNIFICYFVRDDVNNTFVVIERSREWKWGTAKLRKVGDH